MISLALFALAWWLGAHLIARGSTPAMRLAGAGAFAFASVVALDALLPQAATLRTGGLLICAAAWAAAIALVMRTSLTDAPRNLRLVLIAAGLMFGITLGAVLLPLVGDGLPRLLSLAALELDMLLLGLALNALNAHEEGASTWPELARGFASAILTALGFALVLALAAAPASAVFGVVALAILLRVWAGWWDTGLDRLIFAARPRMIAARAELREVAEVLPRQVPESTPSVTPHWPEAEFARLTRRALTLMGDLPKLAAHPLTQLPQVTHALQATGAADNPLNRAAALRSVLVCEINALKPEPAAFGTSDVWRHYNALHWPYVAGLKPYSTRATHTRLDANAQQALAWLQSQVPERTLHNWQNAAASLVATALQNSVTGRATLV